MTSQHANAILLLKATVVRRPHLRHILLLLLASPTVEETGPHVEQCGVSHTSRHAKIVYLQHQYALWLSTGRTAVSTVEPGEVLPASFSTYMKQDSL